MLPAERQQQILALARRAGTVRTGGLASAFNVAEETIRRDLDLLSRRGQLTRTHGGAIDPGAQRGELSHHERTGLQETEKRAVAKSAAALVKSGDTVLVDASSSALALAIELPAGVRLASYSLAVTERLAHRSDLELLQLGGRYEPRGRRFSGLVTENAIRSLRIDRFFFSGRGFDDSLGISEPNSEQARLKALILDHAAWSCALLDHTKLGLRSDHFFARPDQVDVLVIDDAGKNHFRGRIRSLPFQLRIAHPI